MKTFTLLGLVLLLGINSAQAQKSTISSAPFSEKDKNLIASVLETHVSLANKKDRDNRSYFENMTLDLDSTYYEVETLAKFSEKNDELNKFISQNLVRPSDYKGETVLVRFKVERFGEISKIHVLDTGISPTLSAEVIKLVKKMHNWIPAQIHGISVASFYVLPIKF
ncbi:MULTISPECIES: hypothetical protein [unclassified Arcicella]|uniref:energy transducer TonB n=1 Tax=unclassified Arcicella TaxID=2644986 RepID=UPI00286054C2|nr:MULTISPECIES: hypothetical protein [unclassified Arcicella]MDR6564168.1 hypothetical protein [Arcicella sp. BE51]MDR6813921.1 hypothetical protein [Arcicella sp. BE140]MDR6825233.1 hypothetical protein [Arcicella sp. BE139]